ncbi:hypothetical protein M407DRAFT_241608 [Tulasnella calospora MUT 4182]|uniref:DUF7330 domain-containing protein n=1 Tax=Tulasnella calospora MUT 4182 TaxID=1051891 RepID=A0A0C3LD59_9AGAM|nr:hypothetical protein M407DRAFT_241608 [Tulasnella calospora MUT 4182]
MAEPSASLPGPSSQQEPPPYTPAPNTQPDTRASLETPPTLPGTRVNHLYLTDNLHPIKGAWIVDPHFRVHESLLPPILPGQTRDNLHLSSLYGGVTASLVLASDQPCKSNLLVESQTCKVTVAITARRNQHFRLTARSQTASVHVRIPRDFSGPITFTSETGQTVFSSEVHQAFTPFSRVASVGKGFIGDFASSGYGNQTDGDDHKEPRWDGDELIVQSDHGKIKIFYADEPIRPTEMELMWQDFQEAGPIGAVIRAVKRGITKGFESMTGRNESSTIFLGEKRAPDRPLGPGPSGR